MLWPLLWPLAKLYQRISEQRRQRYLSGEKPVYRAPVPVVVVGNITAGGNGKTPVVIWLVEQLLQRGYKPGVVSRGYGAKAPAYPLVVNTETAVSHCGDEPKLIHKRTGVPVVVDPNRSQAVKTLLEQDVNVVITDDGLQHYGLARDVELVVVDGKRRFGNQRFIPQGPLRESVTRLEGVDFVINNGGPAAENECVMQLKPTLAVNLVTGERRAVTALPQLVALAGIGYPNRFFDTLRGLGASLIATRGFADHKSFQLSDLQAFAAQGQHVIMTEKDAVKCDQFAQSNWWYLPVSAEFSPADEQQLMQRITEVIERYGSSFA
nr:tetraacyldisaccharide 4'-kinase [Vibrio agarilyticus]